jgi:hypothetical protein
MSTRAHIFIIVLTVVALLFILRLVRGQRVKAKYSLLWLGVGGMMLLLALLPGVFDRLARRLGVDYQPALFLVLGLGFLLLVVVHLSFELSRMENRVRNLAEEVTFLRHDLRDAQDQLENSQGPPLDPHSPPQE